MKKSIIFLSIVFLLLACTSRPTLNPYIPDENIKVVYLDKDTSNNYVNSMQNELQEPKLLITKITVIPSKVKLNQAFNIMIDLKADIPNKEKIQVHYYFEIWQDNELLFTAKKRKVVLYTGIKKELAIMMKGVAIAGEYLFVFYVSYDNLVEKGSIHLNIIE